MNQKEQLKQLLGTTNALLEAMRYSTSTASGEMGNVGKYGSYQMFLRKIPRASETGSTTAARHNYAGCLQSRQCPRQWARCLDRSEAIF